MVSFRNIKKTLDSNYQLAYLRWFTGHNVWDTTLWRGVWSQKLPTDMWNYQEIITERNVTLVIECGARQGGSTLFFHDILSALGRDFRILSIDIEDQWDDKVNSDRIRKLACSDVSQQAVTVMKEEINKTKGSVFVLLDSNHSEEHVYEQLKTITPLLRTDDYMLVEDTIKEETMSGMMKFMNKSDYYTYDAARESKFGMTMARNGFWIRK
mgnify:FL=1|jgi:cephalosporin hydroxylase|tara:strand:+ start:97 stop:729 length:633 start_codon:yes stop_codon:yes gene_type:complete